MTVAWTGLQPQFATIRRFLMRDDVPSGAEAFLVLNDNGTFTFELMRDLKGEPIHDSMALAGISENIADNQVAVEMARSLRLPEDSPLTSVIGALQERGDEDIAELLISATSIRSKPASRKQTSQAPGIEEILDLL